MVVVGQTSSTLPHGVQYDTIDAGAESPPKFSLSRVLKQPVGAKTMAKAAEGRAADREGASDLKGLLVRESHSDARMFRPSLSCIHLSAREADNSGRRRAKTRRRVVSGAS
uniref:Uncharacterized protein n=1 Tax=Plectus sambesii TaxID=2011161 RepID=A0A914W9T3_9BILA